ncbi:MAG TPA: hypothetical protein VFD80_07630 [Flavobacteriaceae bacterium]|nr:hypothetical protein [Flavobacteriaceae bacterium]
MRWILILMTLVVVGLTSYGFYIKSEDLQQGELFIGLGVAAGFFVWMPLFLYHRWKGKSAKDYMLTKENLRKMKEFKNSNKL